MNINSISLNKKLDNLDLSNPYQLSSKEKNIFLLDFFKDLSTHHAANCEGYKNFLDAFSSSDLDWNFLEEIPALPVRLFKMHDLYSVDKRTIVKTLTSSGTSGQAVSKIYLDADTAKRQSRILASITKNFIGSSRIPMVIIDSADLIKDRNNLNARAAGILGYSLFGRDHFYCLDKDLNLLVPELNDYLAKYSKGPILVFGFTFVVWQAFINQANQKNIKFDFGDQSILIHGGGWKKLVDQEIDNALFKKMLTNQLRIKNIYNYYGMVEQVGSVFMECHEGYLHCPDYADVIIRNTQDLTICKKGEEGIIQVLSILPVSYPGHSLLTEDLGTLRGEDDCACGRKGKYFTVSGRMPMAELRGCSDTRSI